MELRKTELSELICTRISHDLIGSIGAVSSALELIEEDSNTANQIVADTRTNKFG